MVLLSKSRARFLVLLCISIFMGIQTSSAQTYPNRPIKLIAPFPPGGTSDVIGRLIGQKLGDALGQPVIVENRPGASGNIGHEVAAKAPADGYTILLSNSSTVVNNPFLYKQMPYDWYKDFTPITMVAIAGQVLVVHPSVPAKNLNELTALLKANPGKYNFGSGGKAIQSHISGTGVAVADAVAGQIQMVFSDMAPAVPFIKSNKLRALAVTSLQRSSTLPDVPTMAEQGYPGFEASVWWALAVPKGVPIEVVNRINQEWSKIVLTSEIKDAFEKLGVTPLYSKPEVVFEKSRAESPIIGEVMRKAGIEKE